jgi:hypothetical protein
MFGMSFCEYVAGVLLGHASRFFSVKKPQSYLGDENTDSVFSQTVRNIRNEKPTVKNEVTLFQKIYKKCVIHLNLKEL